MLEQLGEAILKCAASCAEDGVSTVDCSDDDSGCTLTLQIRVRIPRSRFLDLAAMMPLSSGEEENVICFFVPGLRGRVEGVVASHIHDHHDKDLQNAARYANLLRMVRGMLEESPTEDGGREYRLRNQHDWDRALWYISRMAELEVEYYGCVQPQRSTRLRLIVETLRDGGDRVPVSEIDDALRAASQS